MIIRQAQIATLLVLFSMIALLHRSFADSIHLDGSIFGTTYHIQANSPNTTLDEVHLTSIVERRLNRIDNLMSTWKDDSEISRFNRFAETDVWFPADEETAFVVHLAKEINEHSDGAFDVTVGPLMALWNFGAAANGNVRLPTDDDIQKVLQHVGMHGLSVELTPPQIKKSVSELEIDLSAIAKGYAVDAVCEALLEQGVKDFMVEIGGEIRTRGANPDGTPWRIGIEAPVRGRRDLDSIVMLRDQAMATSGDYRNFFELDGVFYSHTLDPKSGRPIPSDLASVTVFADTCARADALATTLLAIGDGAEKWADENGIEAIFFRRKTSDISCRMSHAFDETQLRRVAQSSRDASNDFASVFAATAVVFGFAMFAMSIGVIIANRRIRGTCGGIAAMEGDGNVACSLCARPAEDCHNNASPPDDEA